MADKKKRKRTKVLKIIKATPVLVFTSDKPQPIKSEQNA